MNIFALQQFLHPLGYAALKLQRNSVGHFIIPVRINGHVFERFIVDTGAASTVIGMDSLAVLDIPTIEEKNTGGGIGGSSIGYRSGKVRSVDLNGFLLNDFKIYFMDITHVNKAMQDNGAEPVSGVIGSDILFSNNAIIDYSESVLYLRQNNSAT